MNQVPSDPRDDVVRITREEAYATHVDDLLKRQMSLRGEQGITRSHRRRWYYQNWFVFMVAGLLAAGAAWALLEPYFDDFLYIQGTVERVNTSDQAPNRIGDGVEAIDLEVSAAAWIEIRDLRVWLLETTSSLSRDGETAALHVPDIQVGDRIGAYVEYWESGGESIALAACVDLDPPDDTPSSASMSLRDLSARNDAASMLLFPVMAALIGLAIGAADGIVCRLPRRVLLGGLVGLLCGFVGGFVSSIIAGLVYMPLTTLALRQTGDAAAGMSTFGFFLQVCGRSLAWSAAGMAMGVGQGIALRSGRLLLYGFLGGIIGGLVGGLLFDPIDILMLGIDKPSAHWSRLVGFLVIGASVGAMIGLVELLARDAWLRMTAGALMGKEFMLFKDTMNVGSSPRSDIFLFNDKQVLPRHAVVRAVGDNYEIDSEDRNSPILLNGRPTSRGRLHHGDRIEIGRTAFVFQKRRGSV